MKKLKDVLRIDPRKITAGKYGVEIEVEGVNLPLAIQGWRTEKDGSLKALEAFEYVMPKPLDITGVKNSLDNMRKTFDINGSVVHESIRAGVHVHMNVQEWDAKELFTFATVYFILEPLLVKWCGPNREGNLFCLRGTMDAENILFQLQRAVETKNLNLLNDENFRYCSLNFCSLFKYGSIESRAMRSTPDLDLILTWVRVLDELTENAKVFRNPMDAIMSMSGDGERLFLERMLPNFHELFKFPEYEKSIRQAARSVQTLAFTIDWENIGKPSNNPFLAERF